MGVRRYVTHCEPSPTWGAVNSLSGGRWRPAAVNGRLSWTAAARMQRHGSPAALALTTAAVVPFGWRSATTPNWNWIAVGF